MKKITKKKWLLEITSIVMIFLFICNLLTYIVDPFFQYRVKDNQYMINVKHCAPGLIKTYEYDTIIIGSSMTQNFDMELFRNKLQCLPLHIGIGGMTDEDLVEYVLLANKVGKANTYYLCIDIATFGIVTDSKAVAYLMNDDFLSRMQYAISYESLLKFMPMDIVFTAVQKLGFSLPESFKYRMSIDRLGYWGHQFTYSKDAVIDGWKIGANSVSDVDTNDLYQRMVDGIDTFFAELNLRNANYYFFFPPYSSLFWRDAQNAGYFECYLNAEEYFIKKAYECGATVYGFQNVKFTMDLDNYKDTTHYSPYINDWMTDCFFKKENIITPDNFTIYRDKIINNTEIFKKDYSYLLE